MRNGLKALPLPYRSCPSRSTSTVRYTYTRRCRPSCPSSSTCSCTTSCSPTARSSPPSTRPPPYGCCASCSGAQYDHVPMRPPARTFWSASSIATAVPKSITCARSRRIVHMICRRHLGEFRPSQATRRSRSRRPRLGSTPGSGRRAGAIQSQCLVPHQY